MSLFVIFSLLTLASTVVLADIQTIAPSADKQLAPCSIETLVWSDNGASPSLGQIGMMDVVLMQGSTLVRTLVTVDALDMSAAVLLPCQLPPSSDYRLSYVAHASKLLSSSEQVLNRRATSLEATTISVPSSSKTAKRTHSPSSLPTSSTEHPNTPREFDLMTPAAPMLWPTTSSSSVTPRETVNIPSDIIFPTQALVVASRAQPSRELGVHPGLIVMWVGVMCSMLML